MIDVDNRQCKIEINDELINNVKDVIEHALRVEKVGIESEISLIFTDNEDIKEINKLQRNIDKVTDVLSFPMLDYKEGRVFKEEYPNCIFNDADLNEGRLLLGDIVISIEKALEQSEEFGHSFTREVSYLIVHSILHLLGYDHIKDKDKIRMRAEEEKILSDFKIMR